MMVLMRRGGEKGENGEHLGLVIKIEIIPGLELEFGELSENGRCSPSQMYLPHRNLRGVQREPSGWGTYLTAKSKEPGQGRATISSLFICSQRIILPLKLRLATLF
jgi:hypothetical protein